MSEGQALDSPSTLSPQVITRTFLLTVSVKGDLSEESYTKITNYVKKCKYGYVVLETAANKIHLHACLAFETHRNESKLRENIWDRYVKKHHPDSIGEVAVKMSVQYNHTWYDEYLSKEEERRVLYDNYDRDAITSLFPDAHTQDILQSAGKHVPRGPCATMLDHESRWIKMFPDDSSLESAERYYALRGYVHRDMNIPVDPKLQANFVIQLYHFRNKHEHLCTAAKKLLDAEQREPKKSTDREYLRNVRSRQ